LNHTLTIVFLSLMAGLGTALGGLIAVLQKPDKRIFGLLMGLASGVMLTLSFMELVAEAWALSGYLVATAGFTVGAVIMLVIDVLTPHIHFGEREADLIDNHLLKTGLLVAIGISLHNIPEGVAVGAGYMHLPEFGVFVALAIALHNIPEGIATALPLCQGGVCKRNSFAVALLSGLVEPVGAALAATVLRTFRGLIPASLAFAGGVMVFLTLDELIPTAREFGHQHYTAIGIILGAVFVFLLSGALGV
jgi:ZIP family zinc transporter